MKKIVLATLFLFATASSFAQAGFAINTTGLGPDNSSILDVSSNNKGMLIPRVSLITSSSASPITNPTVSLLVYNTATVSDVMPGYYYWNGSQWVRVMSNNEGWNTKGNSGTNVFSNFIGTTDLANFKIKTLNLPAMYFNAQSNFVGIGDEFPGDNLVVKLNTRGVNPSASNYSGIQLKPSGYPGDANNVGFHIGWNHTGGNDVRLMSNFGGDMWMGTNNNDIIHLANNSRFVGINDNNPIDNLSIRLDPAGITGMPDGYSGILMKNSSNTNSMHIGLQNAGFNSRIMNYLPGDLWLGTNATQMLTLKPNSRYIGVNQNNPPHAFSLTVGSSAIYTTPYDGFHVASINNANSANSGMVIGVDGVNYLNKGIWNYDAGKIAIATNNTERITISNNGNVGIGTISPLARLHVADSNVVFTSTMNTINPGNPPTSGDGTRFLWYADKDAFKVGYQDANDWTKDSIGYGSFSVGARARAIGNASFAIGQSTRAYEFSSISIGYGTNSTNAYAMSLGNFSVASGQQSVTLGTFCNATALCSTAIGLYTTASGAYSTSLGGATLASGDFSIAMGGSTKAYGTLSTATGNNTIAKAMESIAMGSYNDSSDVPITNNPLSSDRILQVGNGTYSARSNAITVLRNGNTGIGVLAPTEKLQVAGNISSTGLAGVGTRFITADANGTLSSMASGSNGQVLTMVAGSPAWQNVSGIGWLTSGNSSTSATSNFVGTIDAVDLVIRTTNLERVRVKASGNVGIGNNNARFPLTFSGALGDKIALWDDGVNPYHYGIGIQSGALQIHTDLSGSDILFGYGYSASLTENVRFKGNGNIGFGASSPTKKMEVVGSGASPVTLLIGNRNGFGPAELDFVSDYGLASQWRPGYIKSNDLGSFTGALEFYTNGTGSGNLFGNVKGLEVRNAVTYTATGTVSSFSDERVKKNIQPFTSGLDVIQLINPVSFNYNELAPFQTDRLQVGVVAQDLEKIAPYMVDKTTSNNFTDLRAVNNQAYTFLLINSVKEQQKQIEEQHKEIEALKKKTRNL